MSSRGAVVVLILAALALSGCSSRAHANAPSIVRSDGRQAPLAMSTETTDAAPAPEEENVAVDAEPMAEPDPVSPQQPQASLTAAIDPLIEREELVADCDAKLHEFELRQAEDRFDWGAADAVWEMMIEGEAEREQVVVDAIPFDGSVRAQGDRPTFDTFTEALDVTSLSDLHLLESVDVCHGLGVFDDEEA